jgi:hypothetical protein
LYFGQFLFFVKMCAKKKHTHNMKKLFYGLFVLSILFVLSECQTSDPNDWDVFRTLYDRISSIVTPGLTADGQPLQVFLAEIPGQSIRREDYDETLWRSNGFVSSAPAANLAQLVDRVPTYNSVVFADSGRRISQMWSYLLRQYVVPVELDATQRMLLNSARERLDNGTLRANVARRLKLFDDQLEANLAAREQCLSDREPEVCAQLAVSWRDKLKRRWFALEHKRSELETAESRIIGSQNKDLSTSFAKALERFEQSKRADVGAATFGTEYMATSVTPSNWWQWWPLDAMAYDGVADYQTSSGNVTFQSYDPASTIELEPAHGELTVLSSSNELVYAADRGYIGADAIKWVAPDGTATSKTIAVNGDVLALGGPSWVRVEISASSMVSTADSEYAQFHFNTKLRAQNAIKFSGSFESTQVQNNERVQFASSDLRVEFEVAKVIINRPWLDLTLLDLTPVGVRGYVPSQWSDGSSFFAQISNYAFKLLPTAFIVARNIRLKSSSIEQYRDAIEETFEIGAESSVQIGTFFTGTRRVASSGTGERTFTSGRFSSDGTLEIDGPQIMGWVGVALPKFPTADVADIQAINAIVAEALGNVSLASNDL